MSETRLPQLVLRSLLAALLLLAAATVQAFAQTTSFTYQGRLTDSGTAANGNYDLQFTLWDSSTGGSQVGATQTLNTVSVVGGVFTVTLDFGAGSFSGANRFLEVGARVSGAPSFTILTGRQQVTATPYAIRSVNAATADTATTATSATTATTATNATQLGGVAASQYVQTGDARLSDARPPTAGSANYIQNTSGAQTASFNISGNGTAGGTLSGNAVNTATQYNIGGSRLLSSNSSSVSLGLNTGKLGFFNVFVGENTGQANTNGQQNSFFGKDTGAANTTGTGNSFFGYDTGSSNTLGNFNTFLGQEAGSQNTTGGKNVFVGISAGNANTTGSNNTVIGQSADVGSGNLTNATAIGSSALVTQSNSLVLGSIQNVNFAPASTNVGIGTTAPQSRLHVVGDVKIDGVITLSSLGAASSTQATLCRNTSSQIAFCNSSSLRYKTNISTFTDGMQIVSRLRPISFTWKQDGVKDIGFGAEEVERVAPAFTFRNDKGQIEGVRYDRLGVIFVNAFKEQQAEIKQQQEEIQALRAANSALLARLCAIERAMKKRVTRAGGGGRR